jgi:hypothetical protein
MSFSFHHFRSKYGEAGGRDRFEHFVTRGVKAVHPEAKPVRPNPGDWGLDTYMGQLWKGQVRVWQAKFFLDGLGDSQKAQIRKSYDTARAKAEEKGYDVIAWTLCLPIDLSAEERLWWDEWSAGRQEEDDIEIRLWDRAEFEVQMGKPDAADVRLEYFPHLDPIHEPQPPEVLEPDDPTRLDELLFVHQLRAAGLTELDSAKAQFYNAELIVRDLADKNLDRRAASYRGMQSDYRSTWEDRFNHHCALNEGEDLLPELHPDVMERIDLSHDTNPREPFPLTKTHRKGALHQVVEAGQAGWTRAFRDIAKKHLHE